MAEGMSRRRFLVTLLAALTFAGCSGAASTNGPTAPVGASPNAPASPTTGSNGSTSLDGCKILTAAEAEVVLGVPVTKSDETTLPEQVIASCVWDGGPGTGNMALVNKLLQLHVYDGAIFYTPDQLKDMPGFEKIDGLGDGAYAYGTGSFDLVILAGKRTVSLGASGFTTNDRARVRQAVLDLAPKVLGRI